MAILSNINDKFAVESTGAIQFNGSNGAAGYILKSNGNTSPTWVDPNTVGTGPWLPIAGGAITGNLTIGGTLGVTGNATFGGEINLADNKAILFGGGGKAFIKHDGSNFLFLNDTGNITFTNRADDGDFIFVSDNGSGGTAEYYKIDGGSVLNIFYKDVFQPDNVKSLYGSSSDLQIYHDASNSYISDTGTGRLIIKTNYLEIDNAAGNEAMIEGIENGAVNLFYDGVKKFETTSTGVDVTGTITSNIDSSGNNVIATLNNTDFTTNNRSALKIRQQVNASGSVSAFLGSTQGGSIFLSNDSITANHLSINQSGTATFSGQINAEEALFNGKLKIYDDGTLNWGAAQDSGRLTYDTGVAIVAGLSGKSLVLRSGGSGSGNTALTLDTSQNATFAGKVMLGSGTPVRKLELRNITGARNFGIGLNDKDGAQQATIAVDGNTNDLITASTTNMRFFSGSVIGNSVTLPTNQALVLDTSQNAIFSGNVGIGASVTPNTKLDVNGTTGTRNRNTTSGYGSSIYETSRYYSVAGSATTSVSIDTTTSFPPMASGGYILVEVSASGYASGGANGLVFSWISGGYGGHSGPLSYHPLVVIANDIDNGSVAAYYPNSTEVGITIVNGSSNSIQGVMRVKVTTTY